MRRAPLLVICFALVASACSTGGSDAIEFNVRRVALNLAFVNEELTEPVEPEVIVRFVPAPPEVLEPGFDFGTIETPPEPVALPPLPPTVLCPTAPEGAPPQNPVPRTASTAPAPGTYVRRNQGTIDITGASVPLQIPFPFVSSWTVLPSEEVVPPGPLGTEGSGPALTEFSIEKPLGPTFTVVDRYRLDPVALLLVERKTIVDGKETVFRPDPAIQFFKYGSEGDDWQSAGVDLESNISMVIQGTIEKREVVDVCGDVIETYRIVASEQVVNLTTGDVSGTDQSDPNVYNIANHLGGFVVREDIHTTQRTSDPNGAPIVLEFEYVSTVASVTPG